MFGLGAAGLALEQAIPFGRVWSFPKEIRLATPRDMSNFFAVQPEYTKLVDIYKAMEFHRSDNWPDMSQVVF